MKLLEGKPIAERIKEELKKEIKHLNLKPALASIQVQDNAGIQAYVRSQKKAASELGIEYRFYKLNPDVKEEVLIDFIKKLNEDKSVTGIILQMPLPAQIDFKKMTNFILPEKDAEGMHPANMGKIFFGAGTWSQFSSKALSQEEGNAKILPCTPAAVMELLKETGTDLYGKETVIVGYSEIVGKPLSLLLLEKFATVTVCHIATFQAGKLQEHVKNAEILIVSAGKAGLIKGAWIKQKAVVIDVGINRVGGKIVGDVEFKEAAKRASWITPVPGGVGPLTVTMLMRNVIQAAKIQAKKT